MFHRVPAAFFTFDVLLVMTVLVGLAMLIGEGLAQQTARVPRGAIDAPGSHVAAYVRHLDLPSYWVLYDARDLEDAIAVQKQRIWWFIGHTVFNAAVGTNVLGVFGIFTTMFLAHRALPPNSPLLRLVWLVPLAAFAADLIEDMGVLMAIVAFPQRSALGAPMATNGSLVKFVCWALQAAQWAVLALKWTLAPPAKQHGN